MPRPSSRVASLRSRATALVAGERRPVLVVVSLGWLLVVGTRFVLPALLPTMTADFGLSNTAAGLALTVGGAGYAATQLPAGLVADRLGERRVLGASLVVVALGAFLFAVAGTFGAFLAGCAVLGLGGGLYGPPQGSVLSNVFRDGDGAAFGVSRAAGSAGAATLPAVAGLLVGVVGWRGTFAVFVPALLAAVGGLWLVLPIRTADHDGSTERSSRSLRRVVAVLGRPQVALAVAATTLMVFTFQALTAFLPTYLVTAKGLSQASSAALFAVFFAAGAGFQPVAGRLGDRFGFRRVLVAVGAVGVLPLLALPALSGRLALGVALLVAGTRLGLAPLSDAYIVRILPPEIQGGTWGLVRTVFFVVGASGPLLVGGMADAGYFDEAFVTLAAVTGVMAVLYWRLPARGDGTNS